MPTSNPRSVSVIGVNGWFSATHASPLDIESVGTNALLTNGRNCNGNAEVLAPATVFAPMPKAMPSQVNASASSTSNPAAASQPVTPADGRNPFSTATPITSVRLTTVLSRLLSACPVSTE